MVVMIALVGLPLVGAALAALVGHRERRAVSAVTLVSTFVLAVVFARDVLVDGTQQVRIGGERSTVGMLVGDGLAAGLVLLSLVVAGATLLFALSSQATAPRQPSYWPLMLALVGGLHGLFLAGDLLTAYLMLELIAVTGASLVAFSGSRRQLVAGTRYFYAELVASVTFLTGTALVWSASGTVVIADLGASLDGGPLGVVGLALLTAGLLLKVPVVPLHFWLPAPHTLAPSAVSPLLSALVVKSAFALLLRVWVVGSPELSTDVFAQLMGAFGAVAVIWGGLTALRAERIKQVIASSTIAQLGLLLIAMPMVLASSTEAWFGAVLHAIAHALPKAAVLLAAGLLIQAIGGDEVDRLSGVAVRRPVATFAVGVAALSLIGLPPTGGFVAKWYLVVASIDTGQWWWAAVIVVGSLLTGAYLARLLQRCFHEEAVSASATSVSSRVPGAAASVDGDRRVRPAEVVALGLAMAGLLLGLYPAPLLGLLEVGAPLGVIVDG